MNNFKKEDFLKISSDAPFTEEQKEWLDGYLSGIFDILEANKLDDSNDSNISVTVLWGSQTGNSESLANKFSKLCKNFGISAKVIDVSEYDTSKLSTESYFVIITSTYGEGDPPDNMESFYNFILSDKAPKLTNINYSILALGDTAYEDFCKCGIDLDERFKQLGANCINKRVDCDTDFESPYANWSENTINSICIHNSKKDFQETGFNKKNPFSASIIKNINLNSDESDKETRHIEISLDGSGIEYQPGDALGVYPINCNDLVSEIIKNIGFKPTDTVSIEGREDKITLESALLEHYDIRNITFNLLEKWANKSQNKDLLNRIESENKTIVNTYSYGRELIDLVIDYPIGFSSPEEFLSLLNVLSPRLYSIASSNKYHKGEVHLTVGVVNYQSNDRVRKGVCSTFLSERSKDVPVKIYIQKNKAFYLPKDPNSDLIMVGPGTGIAPFRAFLEERIWRKDDGKNWLFFGNPKKEYDFLYKDELFEFKKSGVLTRLDTAFSRDQEYKIYVQDIMVEKGKDIFDWLENGAYFYVCGDASRMAKDVDKALHNIVKEHGDMSLKESEEYVLKLKSEKRYRRDVY